MKARRVGQRVHLELTAKEAHLLSMVCFEWRQAFSETTCYSQEMALAKRIEFAVSEPAPAPRTKRRPGRA